MFMLIGRCKTGKRRGSVGSALALLALILTPSPLRADDPPRLTPAQTAIFDSNHLHAIQAPVILEYDFRHAAPAESFTDKVALAVQPREDGKKDVRVDFLNGEHHMPFPPALGFNGNPVLMFFLEHDVAAMHRMTGGSTAYFRNRIRQAFADRAALGPTSIAFNGKKQSGTEVTLVPFRNDPYISRFEGLDKKSYRFVLSDSVPGTIYQISTTVPGDTGQPRIEDSLTFSGMHPCEGDERCDAGSPSR